jgi:histidyl-tRNA synthetase
MLRPRVTPRINLSFACRGRHFSIGPPRGTHDLFEPDLRKHRYITECARKMSLLYGFEEVTLYIPLCEKDS